MNDYFNLEDSVYYIIDRYENTLDIFINAGFEQFKNRDLLEKFGKNLSLRSALKSKNINEDLFIKELIELIEVGNDSKGLLLDGKKNLGKRIKVEGVLPCPVTLPLMEGFKEFLNEEGLVDKVDYNLKVASGGVDWLKDIIRKTDSSDELSDIFISAGFDLFFDDNLMGKYKNNGVFKDLLFNYPINKDFNNDYIKIQDPRGEYSIIGVVPAIFLVNKEELGDRNPPKTWADLFKEEFQGEVALPVGDFDLFNAILLNIYKKYGQDGLRKLGKSFMSNMHPQEMVKSHIKKKDKPTITIMPYFFTKMITGTGPMMPIWPEDGAIISPIFLLSKANKEDEVKNIVEFFGSKAVGEILSHNGKFPSTSYEINNNLDENQKFMWIGWDFIEKNDIGPLIEQCEKIFNASINAII